MIMRHRFVIGITPSVGFTKGGSGVSIIVREIKRSAR